MTNVTWLALHQAMQLTLRPRVKWHEYVQRRSTDGPISCDMIMADAIRFLLGASFDGAGVIRLSGIMESSEGTTFLSISANDTS